MESEFYTLARPYEYVTADTGKRIPRPISEADLDYLRKFAFVMVLVLLVPIVVKMILVDPKRFAHEAVSGTSLV